MTSRRRLKLIRGGKTEKDSATPKAEEGNSAPSAATPKPVSLAEQDDPLTSLFRMGVPMVP